MRRVARELDSSPMAIYRHVRDKDQLLVLMLDRFAATVAVPRFDSDPRTRLYQACRAMRDGLARYPWVVDVLAQGDLIAPSILWLLEAIVSGFIACGLSAEQAVEGYRAVWQFTVGELIIRRGLDRTARSAGHRSCSACSPASTRWRSPRWPRSATSGAPRAPATATTSVSARCSTG